MTWPTRTCKRTSCREAPRGPRAQLCQHHYDEQNPLGTQWRTWRGRRVRVQAATATADPYAGIDRGVLRDTAAEIRAMEPDRALRAFRRFVEATTVVAQRMTKEPSPLRVLFPATFGEAPVD